MTRIKRGVAASKRRKNLLKRAKGFDNRRSTNFVQAREALLHADSYAYRDRRNKKRDFRGLWITRISAAAVELGTSYSQFMGALKKADIQIDRKILSELATSQPVAFKDIADQASKVASSK